MTTNVLLAKILLVVAVVCLIVAWLMTSGTVDNGDPSAWGFFGLAAFAASFLP